MNKKRIVCFGDSNTWGANSYTGGRFDDDERWTYHLGQALGSDYSIVEEGLCGRTINFEDPLNEGLSGLSVIHPILMSHSPLDTLVIMLGTNDCKERFSANSQNIADALKRMIKKVKTIDCFISETKILIIAPIYIAEGVYSVKHTCDEMGKLCVEKSRELPRLMKEIALAEGCLFLDCNETVKPNDVDYMHFDKESSKPFAAAVAKKLLEF